MSLIEDRREIIYKEAGSFSLSIFNEESTSKNNSLNLNKDKDINDVVKVKDVSKMINNLKPHNIELLIPGRKEEKSLKHVVKCKVFSANKKSKNLNEATEIDEKSKVHFVPDKLCNNSVFTIKTKKFPDKFYNIIQAKLAPITEFSKPDTFVESSESDCVYSKVENCPSDLPLFNSLTSKSHVFNDFIYKSEAEECTLQKEYVKTCSANINNLCESDSFPKNNNNPNVSMEGATSSIKINSLKQIELPSFLPSDEFLTAEHWEELDEVLSSGLTGNLVEIDYNENSVLMHDDQMEINPSLFSECLGISDPGFNTLITHTNLHSNSSEENNDFKHNSPHLNLEANKTLEQKLCLKTSSFNELSNLPLANEKSSFSVQKSEQINHSTMIKEDRNYSVSSICEQGSIENKICSNPNNGTYLQSHGFLHDHAYLNKFNINSISKNRLHNNECKYPNFINLSRDLIVNSENDIPIGNKITVKFTEDIGLSIPKSKNYNRSDSLDIEVCDDVVENMQNKPHAISEVNKIEEITNVSKKKNKTYYYNHASSLSFLVQNALENIFMHESHPTSANMARLAKLLNIHWKDVKDWFVAKRLYYKKIGYSLRNKPLLNCAYCPIISILDRPLAHLLSRNHIENIVKKLQLECPQFAKAPKSNDKVMLYNMVSSTSIEHYKIPPKYKLPTTKLVSNSVASKLSLDFNSKLKNDVIKNKEKLKIYKKNLLENYATQYEHSKLTNSLKKIGDENISVINSCNRKLSVNSKNDSKVIEGGLCHKLKPQDSLVNYNQIYVGFRCPVCNIIFKNEWMLIKHSLSHRKFICSDCEEVFETEYLLKCHLQQHLMESITKESLPMFRCNQCMELDCRCSSTFPTTGVKECVHPQKLNQLKPFASTDTGVNDHLKVSVEELISEIDMKSHKYKSCLKADSSVCKNSLADEEKSFLPNTYTNIVTFNCHACDSFFFNNYELEEHLSLKHSQETKNDIPSDEVTQKNSQSLNSRFFCSYCYVCYKNEFQLRRHLRFNCTTAPKKLTKMLYSFNLFELMENGKGQHYYTVQKSKNLDANNSLTDKTTNFCLLCNICKMNVDKEKLNLHLSLCNNTNRTNNINSVIARNKKKTSKNFIKINKKKCSQRNLDVANFAEKATLGANGCRKLNTIKNDDEKNCIYICCYCEVPFYTFSSLHSHLKIGCQNRSRIITNIKFLEDRDYKIIAKDYVMKYYEGSDKLHIKQLLSFKPSKIHKRVICKFCSKTPYRKQLLIHLEKFCANITKDIKYLIKVNKAFIKSSSASIGPNLIKDVTDCSHSLDLKNECCRRSGMSSFVYDCHLCDEQFAKSNHFISHLFQKHNLKIEENLVFKWLSQGRYNKIIDNNIEEHIIDQDIILDNIGDMMHVTDNIFRLHSENHVKKSNIIQNSEIITNIQLRSSSHNLINDKAAFMESQKAKNEFICEEFKIGEDDDLLEGVDNLESFVETIQLNDTNFDQS